MKNLITLFMLYILSIINLTSAQNIVQVKEFNTGNVTIPINHDTANIGSQPLTVTITQATWSDEVDNDGDGYTRSRTLRVWISSTENIMASFKIWRNINGGSNSVYWVSPGGTLISQGNYIYELQGIGTSSTGGELSHNYYGFSIFLNAWPSGDLITSLLYSQNSNLNDQKFETANEDQVTTLPDLVVQNISVSSIQVQAGETISASCTVRNIGVGGATSSRVGYYLASNCNSAMQYLGDDAVSSLDPNQSSNENETLIIPANTSPGVYYLVFVADYENSVLESDENNNKACGDAFFNVVSPTPAITVNPTSVNFGNVNIGQNSDQTVTITNGPNSNGNLSGNISVSGNGFSIVSGGGQYDLSPGQTHQIVVRFTPTQSGSHNGTLSISHNAGNQSSPITVPLTGNGVETINITVSPTPINFGNVILGRYKEESVIITNGSNSTGNLIGNISVNGNGITLVSGGGNYNLAFGQSHSTTVRFSPTDSGQHSGILTVTHNAGNHPNPFPVSLSGNGETPTLYINPSSIQVAATAGSVNFNVNSNETWSIGVSCDWVTASSMADSGNKVITVNYFANSNSLPRECQIIIGLDHSIMVEHFMLNQDGITSVDKFDYSSSIPDNYYLAQNYPNPFNPSTSFKFGLREESSVTLKIYDITGVLIEELISNDVLSAGTYSYKFEANNLTSGIYLYSISAISTSRNNNFNETKKMILLR